MSDCSENARLSGSFCKDCGWPAITACCNFDFKDSLQWDWWIYCSNKSCTNHEGEGYFQYYPDWVGRALAALEEEDE